MDVDRTSWGSTLVKNHDENKTYILVKLSESFSNAIQEYSAPRIKFHGSRGAIKFPNGKSYDFSLAQSDNPIECIRQTKNRWESVGKTTCCLHIKGKDDVYQRTRTKMEAAEQEKRKYCTKLLGSPDSATPAPTALTATSRSLSNNLGATTIASTTTATINANYNANSSMNSINTTATTTTTTSAAAVAAAAAAAAAAATTTGNSNHSTSSSSSGSTTSATTTASSTNINSRSNNNNNNNSKNSNINININSGSSNSNYCILSKYPDITDIKQMKRYKADFDKDYKEYQVLHGYLHKIEERFRRLRETLRQRVEGSPEYEAAKDEIFNEYEKINGDSNFHKARSKYKQIYGKLAHIKEKIFQYKREHRDNARKKRKRDDPNQ